MRRLPIVLALGVQIAFAATGCSSDDPVPAAAPPAAQPTTQASVTPRVAALMATAGCKGPVIGTQLYSRETGRCKLAGKEITIATFDTAALRDQWVDAGRQFGGTLATGDRWAAWCTSPDTATAVADKLAGTVH